MGCRFSSSSSPSITGVRVVHLDGFVKDFQPPITAGEITKCLPKHFLFTMSHIVNGSKSIRPEVQLESGCIYFLLPYTALGSDMVSLGCRLTAIARSGQAACKAEERVLDIISDKGDPEGHERGPFQKRVQCSNGVSTWKPTLECIVEKSMEHSSASLDMKPTQRKLVL